MQDPENALLNRLGVMGLVVTLAVGVPLSLIGWRWALGVGGFVLTAAGALFLVSWWRERDSMHQALSDWLGAIGASALVCALGVLSMLWAITNFFVGIVAGVLALCNLYFTARQQAEKIRRARRRNS